MAAARPEQTRPEDRRTLFRAGVIVGCTALIIGVAGVFYFGEKDRRTRALVAQDVCFVRIQGPKTPVALVVTARWETEDGIAREEAGIVGDDPWTWLFEDAPPGRPLTLIVYRQHPDRRVEVSRQPAILTRGAYFEAILPSEGEGEGE